MQARGARLRALRQHRTLSWMHNPLVRTAATNLALILTWCVTTNADETAHRPIALCQTDVTPVLSGRPRFHRMLCRYFFSTCLSLWNKRLVGKEHGVLGLGPFPGARGCVFRHHCFAWQMPRMSCRQKLCCRLSPEVYLTASSLALCSAHAHHQRAVCVPASAGANRHCHAVGHCARGSTLLGRLVEER